MTADRPVRLGVGRTVASWQLRTALAATILGTLLTVVVAFATPIWLTAVLVLAATATVGNPRSHAATVLLALVVVIAFVSDSGAGWWLPLLVLGLHASHVGAALVAALPSDAAVEVDALQPSLRRFLVVQAVGQAIVALVLML